MTTKLSAIRLKRFNIKKWHQMKTVYESETVIVKHLKINSADPLYVTFSSHNNLSSAEQAGAWQGQIEREKRNGLFFIAKDNHWFNIPDEVALLETAKKIRESYNSAVGIGASMGGHAAIRFSDRLKLTSVVAISPQICVSKHRAPFENRWRSDVNKINEWREPIGPHTACECVNIIYDCMHDIDTQHSARINFSINSTNVPLPFSGHSSVSGLGDIGGMEYIFRAIDGPSSKAAMQKITSLYAERSGVAATIILEKAKRILDKGDRMKFLNSIRDPIGMARNKKRLSEYILNQ